MSRVAFKKFDDELRIVYGEVYAPGFPDTDGDVMSPEAIRKAAHSFLKHGRQHMIDVDHDNVVIQASVVESFVARKGDPDFLPDAWVVGVQVDDMEAWKAVKDGRLNGFSMELLAQKEDGYIELEIPDEIAGLTLEAEDHVHQFRVSFDPETNRVSGRTDVVEGHFHKISSGTITDEMQGHRHRYSFIEAVHGSAS